MFLCVYKGGLGSAFGSVGGLVGANVRVRVRRLVQFFEGIVCVCVRGVGWYGVRIKVGVRVRVVWVISGYV